MSKEIDEKVVQMRFDNKDFESNVQTSLSTIDKLKQSLNFSGATKGLENVNSAAGNINMSPLSSAVENVKMKFSALEVMAVTALANITNSALNAGKRIVSALTIDPIKSGFQEYETQINAVQTILANTESKGSTLQDVNKALDELNTYADKTIYNFTEMTRNIGTFTAAGVDLDTSVSAIKGIANLAAVSGSTSQQASTAMYQLSQALAAGTVKLQDWNSVVNAGMGGQVFQDALKETARVHGIAIDQMIQDEGSFRETLQKGWLTSDILTETLAKFTGDLNEDQLRTMGYTEEQIKSIIKMGQTANDAATKVKTFTQLFDTLKEAAQSGWTQSWEIIIGDFEEAKELLTGLSDAISGVINSWAESRNKVLQDWKDLGGRTAIIEGLKNAFNGLMQVINPIKEAFRDVFPSITGEQLAKFSEGFKSLTEKFKMSEETSNNLKRTFKGLFSIINIGKEAFLALCSAISPFLNIVGKIVSGILSVTAVFGDYISGLAEVIDKSDIFKIIIEDLGNFLEPLANKFKLGIDWIKEFFNSIKTVRTGSLDELSEKISTSFRPFTKLGEHISKLYSSLKTIFGNVTTGVSTALKKLGESIGDGLNSPTFNQLFGFVNGGLMTGIILGFKKITATISDVADSVKGLLKGNSVTTLLDGVKDCLSAYQSQLKAETLIKIATAIAILAGSLAVLALIDPSRIASSLAGMAGIMTELFTFMALFDKLTSNSKFKGITKVSTSMIAISIAINILASAMKKLSDLDWNQIAKGLVSVAGMAGTLAASVKLMSGNSGKMISTSIGLVIFAEALNILVKAVEKLGIIDVNSLIKGLVSVGALCLELGGFVKLASGSTNMISIGTGMVILSSAMLILSKAVEQMGNLSWEQIGKGLVTIAGGLTVMTAALNFMPSSMITKSTGMVILASSLLILGNALQQMGSFSWEQIGKGLLTLAGSLTVLVVALNLMNGGIAGAAAMLVVAAAIRVLTPALEEMGSLSWEEIAKGLITLAGALTIITAAMILMTGGLAGAAAMLIMAAAIKVFTPALESMGQMSWSEIGKGLLTLAGAFAVIGVAGLLLTPVVPILALLGAAIALLGVGCLAAGAGVLAFATGLGTLAAVGAAGVQTIISIVSGLIGLIPEFIGKIGEGIVQFAQAITNGAPAIATAITTVITQICTMLTTCIPTITNTLAELLLGLLTTIAEYVPQFVEKGADIIVGFLEGIAENLPRIVAAAVSIVTNFLEAIGEETPKIVEAAYNMIITFINSLAETIENNTPLLCSAIERLFNAIIDSGKAVLKASINPFKNLGSEIMNSGFIQGIKSKISSAVSTVKEIPSQCISAIKGYVSSFVSAGSDLIGGLVSGIKNSVSSAISAVSDVASSVVSAAKSLFNINSPSKVFAEMGMYLDEGLAVGLRKYSNVAANASKEVGQSTIQTMKDTISAISFDMIDTQPTIRPVFDMSSVEDGANAINGLFANRQIVSLGINGGVSGRNINSISSNISKGQNGNDDIVSAIKDLKDSISKSSGNSYTIGGITYDDGSNITNAVKSLVRAAKVERRI